MGILLLTKSLEIAMKRFPQATYMMILGFVLGAVGQVLPGIPQGYEILTAFAALVLGFLLVYKIG